MLRNCCLQKSSTEDQPTSQNLSPFLKSRFSCNPDKNVTHNVVEICFKNLFQKCPSHYHTTSLLRWYFLSQPENIMNNYCHLLLFQSHDCQHLFGSITPLGFKSQFGHKLQSPYSRHHRSPLTLKSTYIFCDGKFKNGLLLEILTVIQISVQWRGEGERESEETRWKNVYHMELW